MNKRIEIALLLLPLTAFVPFANATDVVNGWSPPGSIVKIYSVWSYTYFKLSSTANGCGHAEFWSLATQDSAASKAKLSILIAAYTAGKTVSLRCENGVVSDFEVTD